MKILLFIVSRIVTKMYLKKRKCTESLNIPFTFLKWYFGKKKKNYISDKNNYALQVLLSIKNCSWIWTHDMNIVWKKL